jgi:RNA polymerase sigma-70 factor (ECF subfamily)
MDRVDVITDEMLFSRYRRGDARAFERLYQRYRKTLFRYLVRSSSDASEAEDIYHDVWSRVIHASNPFTEGSFRAYLFQIARNVRIDRIRRQRMHLVTDEETLMAQPSAEPSVEERRHQQDCGERLLREVGQLPDEQRDAFLLKEDSGLTLEQIARLANVGRETIKSRLRYALKRLRAALEDCL